MIISIDKYKKTGGSGGGEAKPEQTLNKTITENGSQTFIPSTGYVFSSAKITTDVHPTEKLTATIKDNGVATFGGEYAGAEITVDVETFTPEGNVDITDNGIHNIANYATATVSVQGDTKNYSNFDGSIDVEGLRAIGWDDKSIGYLRDNALHYAWQNSDYIVSEENKALYGVVTQTTQLKDYPDAVFAPKIQINLSGAPEIFKDCKTLKAIPNIIFTSCKSFHNLFKGCSSLITIPPIKSEVTMTNMNFMFDGCSSLTSIPLLDTCNVTIMLSMFKGCSSLTSIPLLDTSNVTDMYGMFEGCSSLTSIPLLDTSKVTDMCMMFKGCSSLTSIPLLDTTNVTSMDSMFYGCSSLTSIPQLDTSNVTTMNNMFSGCTSLTSIPLLDTSKVTKMNSMLGYSNITTLTDLGGFKNLSISITSYFLDKCPNLTAESLMNVINNLATVSGQSLKFGSTNLNKLTADQIAIATAKGWTLTA